MVAALLAVGLQTVVGWIVSIRLLRLAARTRELPETLLGLSLLLSVGLGYPLRIVGPQAGSAALDWLGNALVSVGFWLFALFVARVFRAAERWASAAAVLLGLGFAAQSALCSGERMSAATFAQMALAAMTYGWGALEASARARSQARQLAIGLGDPAVHNRLWLFTAIGVSVVLGAVANATAIVMGLVPLEAPVVLIATTVSGICFASSALLAFAPPRFYLRRFERSAV